MLFILLLSSIALFVGATSSDISSSRPARILRANLRSLVLKDLENDKVT